VTEVTVLKDITLRAPAAQRSRPACDIIPCSYSSSSLDLRRSAQGPENSTISLPWRNTCPGIINTQTLKGDLI
jgi:hypothetical protein